MTTIIRIVAGVFLLTVVLWLLGAGAAFAHGVFPLLGWLMQGLALAIVVGVIAAELRR